MRGVSFFTFFIFLLNIILTNKVYCLNKEPLYAIESNSVVLINLNTGNVLFEKNADEKAYPASLTKIATALLVLSNYSNKLDLTVKARMEDVRVVQYTVKEQSNFRSPSYWLDTGATTMGIKSGEEFVVRDLLNSFMICSANDAANVVASNSSSSVDVFINELNAFLKEIGCKDTNFKNPHGLHHPDHYTTASDMAKIAAKAMTIPYFRDIVKKVSYKVPQTNMQYERVQRQTNKMLKPSSIYYNKDVIGIKTGYTQVAGKCLVVAAKQDDREVLAVLLNCKDPIDKWKVYKDASYILNIALQEKKHRKIIFKPGDKVLEVKIKGFKQKVEGIILNTLCYDFYPSEEPTIEVFFEKKALTLPVLKNAEIGSIKIINQKTKKLIASEQVVSRTDVKAHWLYFLRKYFFSLKAFCVYTLAFIVRYKVFGNKPRRR